MMDMPIKAPSGPTASAQSKLQKAATEMEATFLAEMLKSAGLGKARQAFGGGAGEDQFASFLVYQQAQQLARSGGVGLAEVLFAAMTEKTDAKTP